VPAHTVVLLIETEKVGAVLVVTVIVSELLLTVSGVAHAALLIIVQLTASLFAMPVLVNVALLVPAFVPFIFHW
jgi:hypothetical protein